MLHRLLTRHNGHVAFCQCPHTNEREVPIKVERLEVHTDEGAETDYRYDSDTGGCQFRCEVVAVAG